MDAAAQEQIERFELLKVQLDEVIQKVKDTGEKQEIIVAFAFMEDAEDDDDKTQMSLSLLRSCSGSTWRHFVLQLVVNDLS